MNEKPYTLKAMLTTDENVKAASAVRFSRIPSDYILLYTNEDIKGAMELPKEGFSMLTDADKAWLLDCVTLVAIEKGLASAEAIKRNNEEFMRNFEKELQAEAEKQREGAVGANGDN